MSYQEERQYVLRMLESGTIDLEQAQVLFQALSPQAVRLQSRQSPSAVVVEIDSSEENLRAILDKLNEAFCHTIL